MVAICHLEAFQLHIRSITHIHTREYNKGYPNGADYIDCTEILLQYLTRLFQHFTDGLVKQKKKLLSSDIPLLKINSFLRFVYVEKQMLL